MPNFKETVETLETYLSNGIFSSIKTDEFEGFFAIGIHRDGPDHIMLFIEDDRLYRPITGWVDGDLLDDLDEVTDEANRIYNKKMFFRRSEEKTIKSFPTITLPDFFQSADEMRAHPGFFVSSGRLASFRGISTYQENGSYYNSEATFAIYKSSPTGEWERILRCEFWRVSIIHSVISDVKQEIKDVERQKDKWAGWEP